MSTKDTDMTEPACSLPATSDNLARKVDVALAAVFTQVHPYEMDVENAREMRFALRLILTQWRKLIMHQVCEKSSYQIEAVKAVDANDEDVKDVRQLTAEALGKILEDAEWGFVPGYRGHIVNLKEHPTNKTMREIEQGLYLTLTKLEMVLREDGSEDLEFSDEEETEEERVERLESAPEAEKSNSEAQQDTYPASALQTTTTSVPKPSRRGEKSHSWTKQEDLELLKVQVYIGLNRKLAYESKMPLTLIHRIRDHEDLSDAERAVELNRRMARYREEQGLPQGAARSYHAVQLHRYRLRDHGVTIESLEAESNAGEKG